jgi:hypothetical protein
MLSLAHGAGTLGAAETVMTLSDRALDRVTTTSRMQFIELAIDTHIYMYYTAGPILEHSNW